jgi:hypothetical protein
MRVIVLRVVRASSGRDAVMRLPAGTPLHDPEIGRSEHPRRLPPSAFQRLRITTGVLCRGMDAASR